MNFNNFRRAPTAIGGSSVSGKATVNSSSFTGPTYLQGA